MKPLTTDRKNEIWKVRNEIRDLLKKHNCHIEIGHTFAFDCFFLCANEEHDLVEDFDIQEVTKRL